MYAHSLNVREEDLSGEMSRPSNNDFLRYVLINEGFSGNLSAYYEMGRDSDLITSGDLLLWRNVSLKKGRGASFVRTSGSRTGANASWPIVCSENLYNRSSTRRSV